MLELFGICKNYGNKSNVTKILKNINLCIDEGEFVAIIGQSGSGKSTLMNIIGCLDTPSFGEYKIDGVLASSMSVNELSSLRRTKFGFIFQKYNLIPSLNALDNVALPAAYDGMPQKMRKNKAEQILSNLGLKDKCASFPNELSGGQQQRVSISRSLINGGEIILADEPTGALDSQSGENVMGIICKLNALGHTVILVTHDSKIASYASRIIEIKDGVIIKDSANKKSSAKLKKEPHQDKNILFFLKDRFSESFKMALNSIFSHKLRSLLTMLGIIIGIASVVSVVALGKGSQQKILQDINSIGTNTIAILPGKVFGDIRSGRIKTLTIDDANLLSKQSYVDSVTPNTDTSGILTYANLTYGASVRGGNEQSFSVNGQKLDMGRLLNKDDIKFNRLVGVIDQNTKKGFFDNKNPIGKVIFFNKIPLTIVGVTKSEDIGHPAADRLKVFIPYTTAINKISGNKFIDSITVKIKDDINAQVAEQAIVNLIQTKHGKKDFNTKNTDSIKKTVESATNTMRLLISCIAVISLFVGGIGVMNIMLVSVTERTKEIGIRMAIGARKIDILSQFLIEAILICLIGGILGVALSFGIGVIFGKFVTTFSMIFSTTSVVFALVATALIGVIFGFIPAKNASELNPIEALNEE